MKLIVSHPTGNANVRAAISGMYDAGILAAYYTALASFPGSWLDTLAGFGPLKEFRRRRLDERLRPLTHLTPWREMGRLFSQKMNLSALLLHEKGFFSIDSIYKSMDLHVANNLSRFSGAGAVYCYEDAALSTFQKAEKLDLQCFYDLPIGYWRAGRKLLENEAEKWPDWAATLTTFKDSAEKLARKDDELRLADRIFVASSFTAKTLLDYPTETAPVEIVPYGFPDVAGERTYQAKENKPLKLLFVGGLSQRKGIAEMFAAVEKLGRHVELTVVGSKTGTACPALNAALAKHKWIPTMPHHEILAIMRQHDVLLFPSLFEGFGLVITEAMAQGTPVITTERTAGPDIIRDGDNGWLIQAGNQQELQNAIENLIRRPQMIADAGHQALLTAAQRPWQVYGSELAQAINYNI
ncbi:glycosyltransferase family 4 protein [Mucilaginibacter sp.]|uniref:glycosyltransferase family 4 protein n=1 Tax=Mucilaginibacter sp. TaxID=1882438 RepID=UPI0035BC08EB